MDNIKDIIKDMTPDTIGLNRISPSMIMSYETCPRSFFYGTFLGLQLPQPQHHLLFGTAIHAAIGNIYDQKDKKTNWELAEFSCVKRTFEDYWTKDMCETDILYDEMYADGIEMLKSYWDSKEYLLSQYGIDILESESIMKLPLRNVQSSDVLPIPLSMRLDAISPNGVVEYKTSSSKYDEEETKQKAQTLAYAYGYKEKYGKLPEYVTYVVLRKKLKGRDKVQVLQYQITDQDLVEFYHRVETILQKISNGEFSKPATGHAPYCDCYKFEELLTV